MYGYKDVASTYLYKKPYYVLRISGPYHFIHLTNTHYGFTTFSTQISKILFSQCIEVLLFLEISGVLRENASTKSDMTSTVVCMEIEAETNVKFCNVPPDKDAGRLRNYTCHPIRKRKKNINSEACCFLLVNWEQTMRHKRYSNYIDIN